MTSLFKSRLPLLLKFQYLAKEFTRQGSFYHTHYRCPTTFSFYLFVAGYIFVLNFNPLSYWTRRQSSYHILFASAIAGFVILCGCVALTALFLQQIPDKRWATLFGVDWLIPSLACIPFSFFLLLLNLIPYYRSGKTAYRAARKRNDSLELLFIKSLLDNIPVALSLKSRLRREGIYWLYHG